MSANVPTVAEFNAAMTRLVALEKLAAATRLTALETAVAALQLGEAGELITPLPPPAPVPPPVPVPPPLPQPSPAPGTLAFASDWSTALGVSDLAFRDGGKWDVFEVGGTPAVNPGELTVVPGMGPGGSNALRMQEQGSSGNGWCRVAKFNFVPPSTDFWLRYYVRNDDIQGASQNHLVQPGINGNVYNDLTYLNRADFASDWRPRLVLGANQGASTAMPNWDCAKHLAYARWYRFEYGVHFTAAARLQVHIQIYDDTGARVASESDFYADPGYGQWTGLSLTDYYAGKAGPSDFGVTPANLVNLEFGNNGSASSSNTGLYWYFAKVGVSLSGWVGA